MVREVDSMFEQLCLSELMVLGYLGYDLLRQQDRTVSSRGQSGAEKDQYGLEALGRAVFRALEQEQVTTF